MKECLQMLVAASALVVLSGPAAAQSRTDRIDFGKQEFNANCASCHGVSAKGDGPLAELLTKRSPDLTQLARRNGGVFPIARLYEIIDGADVPSHGGRDMPVWGRDYRVKAAEYYMEIPYDSEAFVRTRILWLLEYLNRIQAK